MPEQPGTAFWRLWERNQAWRDELGRKAAHKALGIIDDMGVNGNSVTNNYGFGPAALVGVALAAGLPAALLGGMFLMQQPHHAAAGPPSTVQQVLPVTSQPPPATAPAIPALGCPPLEADHVRQEKQPDGTWKEIGRVRVRTERLPDGTVVVSERQPDGTWKEIRRDRLVP